MNIYDTNYHVNLEIGLDYKNLDFFLLLKSKIFKKYQKLTILWPSKNLLIWSCKNPNIWSTLLLYILELKGLAKLVWMNFNQENSIFFGMNEFC